ncbi:mechanosensitive ion channel family protein [Membranihabitans maritimus]|uniref:mechanosensitive ion channel family protein n=1 Tax=Membranihabitans maritimus TaxID=2904244 RepID=UPI001F011DC6|nr:mechanosensitive ion channel domain-containing protein [Membranihabitans maritimus]
MEDLLQQEFQITSELTIDVLRIVFTILGLGLAYFLYRLFLKLGLKFVSVDKGDIYEKKIKNILWYLWLFASIFLIFASFRITNFSILEWIVNQFDIDWDISQDGMRIFRLGYILYGLIIIQLARLLDWLITRFLHNRISEQKRNQNKIKRYITQEEAQKKTNLTVQYLVYGLAVLIMINSFGLDFDLITFPESSDQDPFKLSKLIRIILIILSARLVISVITNVFLRRVYRSQGIDVGRQYSFNQLLSYFIYIAAVLVAIRSLGYNTTIIFGGLAALLVGVGIGLQQTFNDFFSGILLLFERSIEIGDIIDLDDTVGEVEKIGLRTSIVRNRDNIMLIVPNSKLVNGKITNWSHMDGKARFAVEFGVAYDTDLELFEKILIDVASNHDDVLPYPQPKVAFSEISASTFNFKLFFWTSKFMPLPFLQSELRSAVIHQSRVHNIELAYDQLDIRLRNQIIAASDSSSNETRITPLSPDRDFSHLKKNKGEEE